MCVCVCVCVRARYTCSIHWMFLFDLRKKNVVIRPRPRPANSPAKKPVRLFAVLLIASFHYILLRPDISGTLGSQEGCRG